MLAIQKQLSNWFYALLSLPATGMGFALSVQISALSWILTTQYGLKIDEVGFVWLSGPLAGIIGQLAVGSVSDNTWFWGGRRRPYMIIGGVLAAFMLLCLPNLDKIATALGIANMMVVGLAVALTLDLAINVSFNPTRSVIADVTPEGNARTKGYTWMQTISGAFGVLAYAISVWFGNYALIYFGVALVLLFSIIPTFFITEPRTLKPQVATTNKVKETNRTELMKIYVAHGFTWLGVQTMFVFMFAFIQSTMGLTDNNEMGKTISMAFLIMNVVGFVLPKLVLEPITKQLGRVRTHTACIALMAGAYGAIYLFGHTPNMLYVLMALVGIGWAATVSIPFAIATEK
jgi:maltose/moltooligosaccharide transporter